LSRPEAAAIRPREGNPDAPVFAEPWHAQVLAVAHGLSASGLFSASDWATALGAALRDGEARGEPDTDETYYAAALTALERLVAERSPATGVALAGRIEAWRRAYLATPHGKPVELAAGIDPERTIPHSHD